MKKKNTDQQRDRATQCLQRNGAQWTVKKIIKTYEMALPVRSLASNPDDQVPFPGHSCPLYACLVHSHMRLHTLTEVNNRWTVRVINAAQPKCPRCFYRHQDYKIHMGSTGPRTAESDQRRKTKPFSHSSWY